MKRLLLIGITAATFCGAPAIAADMPTKGPIYKAAPAPMFNECADNFVGKAAIDQFTELRWKTIQTGPHPYPF